MWESVNCYRLQVQMLCIFSYFPVESTEEMLEEWRPLLCPFDVTIVEGLKYIAMFIPVSMPPEHKDRGFK